MSSRRHIRRRQCAGKVRYTHQNDAAIAKRKAQQRDRRIGYYHCKVCGFWHLGHRSRSQLQSASAKARNAAERN